MIVSFKPARNIQSAVRPHWLNARAATGNALIVGIQIRHYVTAITLVSGLRDLELESVTSEVIHRGVINHVRDEPFASEKEIAGASAENMVDICRHARHTATHLLDLCVRKGAIIGTLVRRVCRVHGRDPLHSSQRGPFGRWYGHTGPTLSVTL
jgi:hypothetical protein